MHFIYRDYDNSPITEVWVSEDRSEVKFKNYKYEDKPLHLPFGRSDHISYADVDRFFRSRTYDRGRRDLKSILRHMGLREYDPYLMCLKMDGKNWKDGCSIEFLEDP